MEMLANPNIRVGVLPEPESNGCLYHPQSVDIIMYHVTALCKYIFDCKQEVLRHLTKSACFQIVACQTIYVTQYALDGYDVFLLWCWLGSNKGYNAKQMLN